MGKDGFDSEKIGVDITGHALKQDQPSTESLPKATIRDRLSAPLKGEKIARLIEQLTPHHAAAMRLIEQFNAPNAALRVIEQFNARDNAARRVFEQFNSLNNNAATRAIEQFQAFNNNTATRAIEQLNAPNNSARRVIEQFNSFNNNAATRAIEQFHALNNNTATRAIEQFQSANSKAAILAIEHLFSVKDMQIAKVIEKFTFPLKSFEHVFSHLETGAILADASVGALFAELELRRQDVTEENGYSTKKFRNRSGKVTSAVPPAIYKDKKLDQPSAKKIPATDQNLSELPTWLLRFMLNLLIASITAVAQWDQIRASVVDINARFPKTESFIEARNFIRKEFSGKPGDIRLVKGANVHLREEPGMKSAVILQLSENTPVVVLGKEDRTWLWVSYEHEGYWIDGYVSTKHLKNPRKN